VIGAVTEVESIIALAIGGGIILALFGLLVLKWVDAKKDPYK
jgi:hypothetical protein